MTEQRLNFVNALVASAERVGDTRGVTYYSSPTESSFRGFAQMDARARAIATSLVDRGYRPGDIAVIALPSGFDFIEAVFGILYAGLAIAPAALSGIGTSAGTARIAGMVRTAEAAAVITDSEHLAAFSSESGESELGVPMLDIAELAAGNGSRWAPPGIEDDTLFGLIFTSGSTGDPKGVTITYGTVLSMLETSLTSIEADEDSVFVGWAPLHHVMGFFTQIVNPAMLGATGIVTSPEQFQRRPMFWLQLINDHRGTHSVAGNFAFDLCSRFATDEQIAGLDLSSLRCLFSGSEPVRTETVERFVERFAPSGIRSEMIVPAYGSTEALYVTMKKIGAPTRIEHFDAEALEQGSLKPSTGERSFEMVSCGPAPAEGRLAIVDPETFTEVPEGAVGEIWFTSPWVSPGYWKNPAATAETFGGKMVGDDRNFYRSGDLGAVLQGDIFITGRLKDLIIIRGRNIYPQDIEASAVRAAAGVGIGAAFELADDQPSDVGIVLEFDPEVVAEADLAATAESVRAAVVKEFSLPSIGIAFVTPGNLPRTPSGKVRRAITRTLLLKGELPVVASTGLAIPSTVGA
jgi:acyl-CoA synthetase (AMP-forming)/AMP-acid ligase II